MLQRCVARSLSHGSPYTASLTLSCATCRCRCGSVFRNNGSTESQQHRTSSRISPAAWRKKRQQETLPLTPELAKRKRELEIFEANMHHNTLQTLHMRGVISADRDICISFLNEFDRLATAARGRNVVDLDEFSALRTEMGMLVADLHMMSRMLLGSHKDEDKTLGKKLLFTLSSNGDEEATIRILNHALLASKTSLTTLRSSEIVHARGHLREISRRGENYRAMVLEGKIAYELGDDDYAIGCWNRAMDAAVAAAEERETRRSSKRTNERQLPEVGERDLSELSSPWIELTRIHYERFSKMFKLEGLSKEAWDERDRAKAANLTGCEQDDPESHFYAAEYFKDVNRADEVTSSWLYHMTKAAASGHVKACHALAEFYASSVWKYIDDEPSDHVKPTPFDSYPVPISSYASGVLDNVRRALGLTPVNKPHPKDSMFHTAVFPSTPSQRQTLALQWLDVSRAYLYAPSYLLLAKIYLTKHLWGQAYAPKSALRMSNERYLYASRANYKSMKAIPGRLDQHDREIEPDSPNPGYKPDAALSAIREVFYAVQLHNVRRSILSKITRKSTYRNSIDADEMTDETLPKEISSNIRKWLYNPEVWEMYEHQIPELEREARQICDEQSWDVFDEQGGLLYKHGLQSQ